jgi:hypothetical protein
MQHSSFWDTGLAPAEVYLGRVNFQWENLTSEWKTYGSFVPEQHIAENEIQTLVFQPLANIWVVSWRRFCQNEREKGPSRGKV